MKQRKFNRLLALALALCLLLGLTACASSPTADSAEKPGGSTGKTGSTAAPGEGGLSSGLTEMPESEPSFFYRDSAGKTAPGGGTGTALTGEAEADGDEPIGFDDPVAPSEPAGEDPDPDTPPDDPDTPPDEPDTPPEEEPFVNGGEALRLTAAEWNDNANWPFFSNLVNAGTISFPRYGLYPCNRIAVTVTNPAGLGQANETVTLLDAQGSLLWTARTDKTGTAYVFYAEGQTPDRVVCGGASAQVLAPEADGDPQGQTVMKPLEAVVLESAGEAPAQTALQVMFIVDTTGSMADEIAYLQKDFAAIAGRVGSEGVTWSVSFYRDEGDDYVTRHSPFTDDVAAVQSRINAEYADGGGDYPEAVAEVLTECLTQREDWDENAVKVAFLIFDAPPHDGKDAALQAAAKAAAAKGIHVVPVVASNGDRDTELFGRALAILTNGTYVFLTDDSGVSVGEHLEPIIGAYTVELLQDLIVRLLESYRP